MSVLQLAREQQPGLDGVLARGQFAAEGAVALLQPQRLDRVVAAAADAERRAPARHQVLVDADGEFGGHVELPAQFADVGDPGRAHGRITQRDLLAGAERERFVGRGRRRSGVASRSRDRGPITPNTA